MTTRDLVRVVRKRLGRIPLVRRVYAEVDLVLKYRELHPERVPLAGTSHILFANPREPRGRAILGCYGAGQPGLKRLWARAIEATRPRLVVDVGANYGEFLFMVDYAPDTIAIGIEADPSLRPYLERSRAAHPHRAGIEVVQALAGEKPAEPRPFYVDEEWSGRSSALKHELHRRTRVEMIPTESVDHLLGDRVRPDDSLVFKIDVEGYEPFVIEGMQETFSRVARATGIMEFNTAFLRRLGRDPEAYLDGLRARFGVFLFDHLDRAHDLRDRKLDEVVNGEVIADLVVSTDPEVFSCLFA